MYGGMVLLQRTPTGIHATGIHATSVGESVARSTSAAGKGKPVVRRGRKAKGPPTEAAWLPKAVEREKPNFRNRKFFNSVYFSARLGAYY
jgi:hypothetical protein